MLRLPFLLAVMGCRTAPEPPRDTDPTTGAAPVDTATPQDTGVPPGEAADPLGTAGGPPRPVDLQGVRGEGFNLIWTSRALLDGERVERSQKDGTWVVLAREGSRWLDETSSALYRVAWVLGDGAPVAPEALTVVVREDEGRRLLAPGEVVRRLVEVHGPRIPDLRVGLALWRPGDETWLSPACGGGSAPCWRPDGGWWQALEGGGTATPLEVLWFAEETEPRVSVVEARIEVEWAGSSRTLASGRSMAAELGRELAWGDLHTHTNFSFDGCEDHENSCLPRGPSPGADLFSQAAANGLQFAAITDHAEYGTYTGPDGVPVDIWEETLKLAQAAEGGAVVPIVGFEWTGGYRADGHTRRSGGHRTVVFESLEPCAEYPTSAGTCAEKKHVLELERYDRRAVVEEFPDDFEAVLAALSCPGERYLSWFHHPAVDPPAAVDWLVERNDLGDTVVEVFSEHGSSECSRLDDPGCEWRTQETKYRGWGSWQVALQQGFRLGAVGASDDHQAKPGNPEAGEVAYCGEEEDGSIDLTHTLNNRAGVTGALVPSGDLTRAAILDALEDRHTVAASRPFPGLRVAAVGADGALYLPGSDVPQEASPLELRVELEDPEVEGWTVELLDPWGVDWINTAGPVQAFFELGAEEIRYVRIRALVAGEEERVWASPFFGTSTATP